MNEQLPIRVLPELPKLYTRSEISDLVGMDHSTISRWEKKGKITPSQKINGTSFYTEDQYLEIKKLWQEKPSIEAAVICSSCNRRRARAGSTLCSRCSFHQLESNLRDTLPGMVNERSTNGNTTDSTDSSDTAVVEEPQFCPACGSDDPAEKRQVLSGPEEFPIAVECTNDWHNQESSSVTLDLAPGTKTYTRREVSEIFDISPSTISRWERKGKIPLPIRVVHSNQYIYTDKHIEEIKKYIELVDLFQSTPATPLSQAGKTMTSKSISRRLERAVASRIRFGRGNLL